MNVLDDMRQLKRRADVPALLSKFGLTHLIAEVGVRFGYHFEAMLACRPDLAIAIDHWRQGDDQDTNLDQKRLDEIYADVCRRFMHRSNVRVLRSSSKHASTFFPLCSFDYVYIDANHEYKPCFDDICIWWKRLRQGGILAGHDYIESAARDGSSFGVIPAVAKFMLHSKLPKEMLHSTEEGWRSWFIYKAEGE